MNKEDTKIMQQITQISHVSFSGLKIWNECPFKYRLNYVDKIGKFAGNVFTAFGTAMHEVCEKTLKNEWKEGDAALNFQKSFIHEIEVLPAQIKEDTQQELVDAMMDQGALLAPEAIPGLKSFFKEFEVVSLEENLMEPIEGVSNKFKGFVDLLLRTPDGKYHIVDWKTCSWGWDMRRKSDKMTTYQLTLYKHFIAKKHNIPPEMIETYFALLKRTAKKNRVEIFRVTSGKRKTENALQLLDRALFSINKEFFPKNRLSCSKCELHRTQFCP